MVEHNLAKVRAAGSIPVSRSIFFVPIFARVAELVDARDLKSLGVFLRAGSSPASGTMQLNSFIEMKIGLVGANGAIAKW